MGEQLGKYRLDRLLGRGGMGAVWLARDTDTGRTVALKVLAEQVAADAEYRQRFEREARLGSSLRHPNIVQIHGFGELDGRLFIDMEYIDGIDLAEMLTRVGTLTPTAAADFVTQVASGLDAAHRAGLIHRDVKPSNILIGTGGHAYLIDFGIARSLGQTSVTATGMAIGSWAYMAPERFNGTVDARSDVYSLACVLYECLTGRRPYGDTDPARQMHDHLMTAPPDASTVNPAVPAEMDAIIARGMAKDQAARYPTAREFAAAAYAAAALSRLPNDSAPQSSRPESATPSAASGRPLAASAQPPGRQPSAASAGPSGASAERAASSRSAGRRTVSDQPLAAAAGSPGASGQPSARPPLLAQPKTAQPHPPPAHTHMPAAAPQQQAGHQHSPTRVETRASMASPPPVESPKPLPATKVLPEPGPTPTLVATRLDPAPQQNSPWSPNRAVVPPGPLVHPPAAAGRVVPQSKRVARIPVAPRWTVSQRRPWLAPPARRAARRRPRRKSFLSRVIGALVVMFLTPFMLAAGCAALVAFGNTGSGGGPRTADPSVAVRDGDTAQSAEPPGPVFSGLNTPVRDGKFEFVVTAVDSGISRIGLQNAGGTYSVVTVAVRNISAEPKWFLPVGQRLVDTEGRQVDHNAIASMWQNTQRRYNYSFELQPGQSATTQLVFDVPQDAAPSQLELHDFMLSNGVTVHLN
ncbi:protein kinase domain-containing protein [Nocardia sp. CA-119907]|uniref:serine/threonine-protein kinase n=1 Tax=Nocardia sp. CA-119907 TaxID=3239973 RepID=UPI003D993617